MMVGSIRSKPDAYGSGIAWIRIRITCVRWPHGLETSEGRTDRQHRQFRTERCGCLRCLLPKCQRACVRAGQPPPMEPKRDRGEQGGQTPARAAAPTTRIRRCAKVCHRHRDRGCAGEQGTRQTDTSSARSCDQGDQIRAGRPKALSRVVCGAARSRRGTNAGHRTRGTKAARRVREGGKAWKVER